MNIESVTRTASGYRVIMADGRVLNVPDDPMNADYQSVQAFLAAQE